MEQHVNIRALVSKLFTHFILIIATMVIGLPFLWMLSTSIKGPAEVRYVPAGLVAERGSAG